MIIKRYYLTKTKEVMVNVCDFNDISTLGCYLITNTFYSYLSIIGLQFVENIFKTNQSQFCEFNYHDQIIRRTPTHGNTGQVFRPH